MMPTFALRHLVLSSFPQHMLEKDIAESVDFMLERVSSCC